MSEHGYDAWKTTESYMPEQELGDYADCDHLQFLDADGICTRCGEDCRPAESVKATAGEIRAIERAIERAQSDREKGQ